MGNKQKQLTQGLRQEFNFERFREYKPVQPLDDEIQIPQDPSQLQLDIFKSLPLSPTLSLSPTSSPSRLFNLQMSHNEITIHKQFPRMSDLQAYISNLIKISKMLDIILYDEIKLEIEDRDGDWEREREGNFGVGVRLEIKDPVAIGDQVRKNYSLEKKLDLLRYIALLFGNFQKLYFGPEDLMSGASGFHLINFVTEDTFTPSQMFLAFFRWLFTQTQSFYQCLITQTMPPNLPIYLQDIYYSLMTKSITVKQLECQLPKITDKMTFLLQKADSFYACKFFNKLAKYPIKSQWIFLKAKHQIFFYHIVDHHAFTGKLIRKKKKKDIGDNHITFDHEDLEVLYVPENSKLIVRAAQFQFQSSSSISDLQVKHKLPLKFKNTLISRSRNGNIFLLQQYLYTYQVQTNKLIQESKRITDYIFLTSTKDSYAFIIKISIDIFRNGIRVYYRDQDIVLAHTGDQKILEEIATIRVDVRAVVFCTEVYKGVFVLMAAKNMWVLDLNFQCFFSFATPSQIKKLATFQNDKIRTQNKDNDLLFQVLNQPFKVDFNIDNDGNHVAIKQKHLHIIGLVEHQPYYLKYSFMHRIGAIKLEAYHPLFVCTPYTQIVKYQEQRQTQTYKFNFHQQNSHLYKYKKWIYTGPQLIKVYDFHVKFEKSTYQVYLTIEKLQDNLKERIEKLVKYGIKLENIQILGLLYKVFLIFQFLFKEKITHSNISINHLCFTTKKELKLNGWSEPPRNWHVSDFKDYLLVCFNIITYSCYQKINEKIISKHSSQLSQFPILSQKITTGFRLGKTIQKQSQIQKNLQVIKSYLQKQLAQKLQIKKTNNYIFSFEYKTPRMTIISTQNMKMKKITIIPDQTLAQQFVFNQTDYYVWVEEKSILYIFTAAHQFFQLRVDFQDKGEQKVCLEDYQYLPNSIMNSTFVAVAGEIYSFGGIKKEIDGRSTYSKKIYKFSWKILTWQVVGQLPQPRINPHAVVSICKKHIYLFGGTKQLDFHCLKLIKFHIDTNISQMLIDQSLPNITSLQNHHSPMKFFHLSEKLNIFMQWSLSDGDYVIRYISFSCIGFCVELRAKNYSSQNSITQQSITLNQNQIHILRPYGRYTKITLNRFENIVLKNQTIYAL